MFKNFIVLDFAFVLFSCQFENNNEPFFRDEFNSLTSDDMYPSQGAHTEYHFIKAAAPNKNWALSTFRSNTQNSWGVQSDGDDKIIYQRRMYEDSLETYPVIIS